MLVRLWPDWFWQVLHVCLRLNNRMTGEEGELAGIIPRLIKDIFHRIDLETSSTDEIVKRFEVYVSFFEIYNEKVIDLLNRQECKVREHPIEGPYVENLTK